MKATRNIQLKAVLLLVIFSANTLIGFACSLGIKMGYNNHHHPKEKSVAAASSHQHHHHKEETKHSSPASHSEDDCCSNGVTAFNLLDKTTANSVSFVHPVFASAFVVSFYAPQALPRLDLSKNIRAFARSYHPPIPDIRVAIRSFQI